MHFVDAKGILSAKNGMNIYRGCTHGCIYCDSRSECYQITHPFEDIEVKQNAPELLEKALKSKRKQCMIGTGAMCDPYMHCEEDLKLTRRCLELIEQYGYGATVLTKSTRILRDLDLLEKINQKSKCVVQMTLTTYDEKLCKILEPNVSTTKERFEALKIFRDHGIPTVVWFDPILPYINDTKENVEGILNYCIEAKVKGIISFGMGLTLRKGNREYFYKKLDEHFPGMKMQYHRKYGYAYSLDSDQNDSLMHLYHTTCKKHGIETNTRKVFQYLSEFPENKNYEQITFF